MAFDWGDFLQIARHLQSAGGATGSKEAAERSGVSRAYYAAYGHARNRATKLHRFKPSDTGDDHRLLREHFHLRGQLTIAVPVGGMSDHPTHRNSSMDDLRRWRNQSDYDAVVRGLGPVLAQSIVHAERVIASLP